MAHKSRLGCIVIDCEAGQLDSALAFWSGLFGCSGKVDEDGKYAVLKTPSGEPKVLIQAVDHAPRVHLDVESDDREAEALRLEALGAKRIAAIKSWIVMEAPTGHRFCIVPPQRDDFDHFVPAASQ